LKPEILIKNTNRVKRHCMVKNIFWVLAATNIICCTGSPARNPTNAEGESVKAAEVPRVIEARKNHEKKLKYLFSQAGLAYPPKKIFLRAFKFESLVELWARDETSGKFKLVNGYRVCKLSGNLGPKRREGDRQVPEGFYHVAVFNPESRFYLSLGLDYPNKSDLVLGNREKPGGDIFIHGSCMSAGCLAMRDGPVSEIYLAALVARTQGQEEIPVHIFPCRMDKFYCGVVMDFFSIGHGGLKNFWNSLEPCYNYFESGKTLPLISVKDDGYYECK